MYSITISTSSCSQPGQIALIEERRPPLPVLFISETAGKTSPRKQVILDAFDKVILEYDDESERLCGVTIL